MVNCFEPCWESTILKKNKDSAGHVSQKNDKGQSAIEAVLLIVIFVSITATVAREFKESEVIAELISGPWKRLDGMIQNGVWQPVKEGNELHPNRFKRHVSFDPEDE